MWQRIIGGLRVIYQNGIGDNIYKNMIPTFNSNNFLLYE